MDAPITSNMTNIYSETRLWGTERVPSSEFASVPKLDLTGIDSDSSISSVEAQFASRFESEFSLPVLQSIIPMDSAELDTSHKFRHLELISRATNSVDPVSQSSSNPCVDTSQSRSDGEDSEFSESSSLEGIELSAFQFEIPVATMTPIPIEALMPSRHPPSEIRRASLAKSSTQTPPNGHVNIERKRVAAVQSIGRKDFADKTSPLDGHSKNSSNPVDHSDVKDVSRETSSGISMRITHQHPNKHFFTKRTTDQKKDEAK
jgi:hypothetical protein